jgi:hypothetical protein
MTAFVETFIPSPCCKIWRSKVVFPVPLFPTIAMVLPNGNWKLVSLRRVLSPALKLSDRPLLETYCAAQVLSIQ